ncbi:unnamed protein product [Ranitomeya imitator]|uniref:A20-type domain-containing protein n=1 Tax=Ranitomeya imitator TaxID=111125 RepID=A0ABN9M628_9NEOB|nr:unnamed protein product [Ranitomeya imitator]
MGVVVRGLPSSYNDVLFFSSCHGSCAGVLICPVEHVTAVAIVTAGRFLSSFSGLLAGADPELSDQLIRGHVTAGDGAGSDRMIMSFASPEHKARPLPEDQTLPHFHADNASFQLQGFLYQAEMCRKNCGFYGNPAWHGYCSRCWIQQRQQAQPLADGFRHQTGNLQVKPDMDTTTQRLNRNNTFPDVTSNNVRSEESGSVLHFSRPCLLSLARGDFSEFLKVLRSPEAQPLSSLCSNFIRRMQDANHITVDKKAEEVQSFYQQIVLYYPDHMSDEKDQLLNNIEKLVMTRLYKSVFCLENSQDEQKDLSLQKRIKSLSWVTSRMLQLPLEDNSEEEKNGISCAATGKKNRILLT